MFDDASSESGGGGEDDVPWSSERFVVGDRVKYTAKAIRRNIPTKSRRDICGMVTAVEVATPSSVTYTVTVLWDGYKRPHRYAASFITKT